MIAIKHLEINKILALNNPHVVDIPLSKTKQNIPLCKRSAEQSYNKTIWLPNEQDLLRPNKRPFV